MAFPILLFAFIVVPISEIWILLRVGAAIGGGTTLLVVIFTAILGTYLVRQQGFATLQSVQQQMNAGQIPAMEMAEGFALLIAGVVLLTPGFMTDFLGFALLTPPLRRFIIRWIGNNRNVMMQTAHSSQHNTPHSSANSSPYSTSQAKQASSRPSTIIEGEYSEDK